MIVGYRHTGIIVSDLEESLKFYQDFLGLKLIQKHIDESQYISKVTGIPGIVAKYAKLEIPGGNVLELLNYPSHAELRIERKIHQPGEAHLAFEVSSISDMFSKVLDLKIEYVSEPELSSEGIAKVFFCFDPDRYRIEFVEMLTTNYVWKVS